MVMNFIKKTSNQHLHSTNASGLTTRIANLLSYYDFITFIVVEATSNIKFYVTDYK